MEPPWEPKEIIGEIVGDTTQLLAYRACRDSLESAPVHAANAGRVYAKNPEIEIRMVPGTPLEI